ncbi:hypothetical protein D9611_002036 [Ephemerocybe angulata]|nr:hypothetical protein D9611_002036 [Tulosesus angulatus]
MNIPVEHVQRGLLGGMPTPDVPLSQLRNSQPPKKLPAGGKQVIVKIQISPTPLTSRRYVPMHVYTQKHDFACYLRREDCPEEWDRVYAVIKNRTLSGLKGYFVADIKSRDEFVVKISEPLAAQPW